MLGICTRPDIKCDWIILIDAINQLDDIERKVIKFYYGIDGECYCMGAIKIMLNVNPRNIIKKALKNLRILMLSKDELTFDILMFEKLKTICEPRSEEVNRKFKETLKNKPIRICPHCNKHGKGQIMSRWHFDNCKHKEN